MAELATLMVKIGGDDKGANEALDRTNSKVKESSGFFKDALKNAIGFAGGLALFNAGAGAIGGLTGQLSDMVKAGEDANRIDAVLQQGLVSTKDASGQTMKSLDDLSVSLMNHTGITDDAVKAAEQMLLTFTGIGKDAFPQATQAAADMATRMNGGAIPSAQQMQQQALLLGKALNDPIKGVTALTREGVTFTDQQKAQIKAMEQAGNTAGAQQIILAELNKEFGGSAAAAGQANGGIAILSAQFDNMKQSIGQALIPILLQLMKAFQPILTALTSAFPVVLPIVTGLLTNVFNVGKQVADIFIKNLKPALDTIFGGFESAAKGAKGFDLSSLIGPITTLADALSKGLAEAIKTVWPILLELGAIFVNDILPILGQVWNIIVSDVIPILGQLADIFTTNVLPAIDSVAKWAEVHLFPALKKIADLVKTTVMPIVHTLAEVFQKEIIPAAEKVGSVITDKLLPPLENILKKILPVLNPLFQTLGWIIGNVVGPVVEALINGVAGVATGISSVIDWIGKLFGWFGQVGDQIGTVLGHFGDLANSITNGIGGAFNGISTTVQTVFGGLWDIIKIPINLIIGGINALIGGLDSIQVKIPDWSPIAGGKTFGINIPKIPTLATGGDISGPFIGAERGMELLVTPGLYHAPPGSHVYNAQQTAEMLRAAAQGKTGGNTYVTNVYPQQAVIDTRELARIQQRRDRLAGIA